MCLARVVQASHISGFFSFIVDATVVNHTRQEFSQTVCHLTTAQTTEISFPEPQTQGSHRLFSNLTMQPTNYIKQHKSGLVSLDLHCEYKQLT